MSSAPLVEDILNLEPDETMEAHILQGFHYRTIEALQNYLNLSQVEMANALGVSRQTLIRNLKAKKHHLSAQLSDQLYRVARITRRAVEVFDQRDAAARWLKHPNPALGSRPPLHLLKTDAGAEKVAELLGRIEFGVYS
ncbi:type II RES/Xre toxin-antitoxin system antitoxin [Lujinxingia litoralis]|nr:antitoxin Xre/MbcA/ParS toxin-binding domain-containing protein [Lujinxingia litoralis]